MHKTSLSNRVEEPLRSEWRSTVAAPANRGAKARLKLIWLFIFCIVGLNIAGLLSIFWSPRVDVEIMRQGISAERGYAYTAPIQVEAQFPFEFASDSTADQQASTLRLVENGRPLGPAHSLHDEIRAEGHGRYSHWTGFLYFSTSDGSDPRTNGRQYFVTGNLQLWRSIWMGLALIDIGTIVLFWQQVAAFLWRRGEVLMALVGIAAVLTAGLLAAGIFGVIDPAGAPAKNANLVIEIVTTVALVCVVTLAQWVMGAGLARLLLPKSERSYTKVMLLGFPLSLIQVTLLALLTLAVPLGWLFAIVLWLLCVWPLFKWPLERIAIRNTLALLPGCLVFSMALGCWMALMWHGPTASIPGMPSVDIVVFSSIPWLIAAHPIEIPNLAFEGEFLGYANRLFPTIAATLVPRLQLDGFLFTAGAAAMGVLNSSLALHAYLTARPPLKICSIDALVLLLAFLAAGRTPSWLVSSPAVDFIIPVTVATWFWATEARKSGRTAIISLAMAIIGCAMAKVVAAATLVPLALAAAVPAALRSSRRLQIVFVVLLAVSAIYSLWMLVTFLPSFLTMAQLGLTTLGPASYQLVMIYGAPLASAWPVIARDGATLLLMVISFRLTPIPIAAVLTFGLFCALAFPFLTIVNFLCVTILLGLAAIDNPVQLRRSKWLVLSTFLLALPAMIHTEESGVITGIVWIFVITGVVLLAISSSAEETRGQAYGMQQRALTATAAALTCLVLVASANGTLILSSNWHQGSVLTPDLRNIWRFVREHTPLEALIFTDQTGNDHDLLGGWNVYMLNGVRQAYIAGANATMPALLADPDRINARLKINTDVLAGRVPPSTVATRGRYGSFFAVVSVAKQKLPEWEEIYRNQTQVLYHWK